MGLKRFGWVMATVLLMGGCGAGPARHVFHTERTTVHRVVVRRERRGVVFTIPEDSIQALDWSQGNGYAASMGIPRPGTKVYGRLPVPKPVKVEYEFDAQLRPMVSADSVRLQVGQSFDLIQTSYDQLATFALPNGRPRLPETVLSWPRLDQNASIPRDIRITGIAPGRVQLEVMGEPGDWTRGEIISVKVEP